MSTFKILIVDDNHDLADGLGMVLEDEGYQVTLAYNGTDAIKIFDSSHFDLVFIDIKLPDMNGIELFQYIHKNNPEVETIMMTGFRIEQVLTEVIENGDVKVLREPFEINHVLESLNQVKDESIILVSNDNPGFSERMLEFLTDNGMKTILAKNSQKALDSVLLNSVDALVLDLNTSVMRNLELYLQLKKQGKPVKTIIVTRHKQKETEKETEAFDNLKSLSVTGCLFKPFNPDDMLDSIKLIKGIKWDEGMKPRNENMGH